MSTSEIIGKVNELRTVLLPLEQGRRAQLSESGSSNSLSILVSFPDGVAYEERTEWGISHFLEHINLMGTPRYPTLTAISSVLEEEGGKISAYSVRDSTNYWVTIPDWGTEKAFGILADVLANSHFSKETIDSEKTIVIREMEREHANFRFFHSVTSEGALLLPHPIGRHPLGSKDLLEALTPEQISAYKQKACGRSNCYVSVAGKTGDESVLRKGIEALFSALPEGMERHEPREALQPAEHYPRILEYPGLSQINLIVGWGIREDVRAHWLTIQLLNTLLGVGFGCLLYRALREESQLTYLVATQSRMYLTGTTFRIALDVSPEDTSRAIELIKREIGRVRDGSVSDADLERARSRLFGNLILSSEDSLERAKFLNRLAILDIEPPGLGEMGERIFEITKENLAGLAREFFLEEGMKISLAGSRDALAKARLP